MLKEQVLEKHGKALVIYGAAHFYRAVPPDYLASMARTSGSYECWTRSFRGARSR